MLPRDHEDAQRNRDGYKGLGLGAYTGTTGSEGAPADIGEPETAQSVAASAEPEVRDAENMRGARGIISTSSAARSGSTMASIGLAGTNMTGFAPGEEALATSDQEAKSSGDFGEEARPPYVQTGVAPLGGMGGTTDSETAAEDAWGDTPSPRPDDNQTRKDQAA